MSVGFRLVLVPALLAAGAGFFVPSAPAAAAATCSTSWGSTPEVEELSSPGAPITNVRTGRHPCFDRLVIDLVPAPGYDVRYVDQATGGGLRGERPCG